MAVLEVLRRWVLRRERGEPCAQVFDQELAEIAGGGHEAAGRRLLSAGYDHTAPVADALATILRETPAADGPILLVISSDMNHFAPETENRRRDALALNAMRTGDPRRLFEVCRDNEISMCGVLPAVTVVQALLRSSSELGMELVDYTTSAAASGDTSRVVGYAGMVIE